MRYAFVLLLALAPLASAQTHSATYTGLTSDDRKVFARYLPAAENEVGAVAGYAARIDAAQAARSDALEHLVETMRRAQGPVYGASVASISTVSYTIDVAGDLVSLTISSATPLTTRVYTTGLGGFTTSEADVALEHAQAGAAGIQGVLDAQAAQAAHRVRLRRALRLLTRALVVAGKTPYPGTVNGITTLTVTRDGAGVVQSILIAGD